ncbi:hypothetical protein Q3G72_030272 [Acer saccharum]|nr:hypothetical protein Q3G72_030272 [Acer saccharum]
MHLKSVLTNVMKGTQSITEYMQHVKNVANELAMLDAPESSEDLTVKILNGLGDEFKDISSAIRACDFAISFKELHEKLINFEAVLKHETVKIQKLPITANFVAKPLLGKHQPSHHRSYTNNKNFQLNPRHTRQGHTAKRCSAFTFTPAPYWPQADQPP